MTGAVRPREDWEIRGDARTLAEAEAIKADKERYKEAQMMAKQMAEEDIKRMSAMLKVAGKKPPKQSKSNTQTFSGSGGRYPNPATIGRL